MAPLLKLLFAALLLHCFATTESQRCDLSTIQVQQTNTGAKVGYDPMFEVSVFLQSEGFASSMMVDPRLFCREGIHYLINDGKGIPSLLSHKFQREKGWKEREGEGRKSNLGEGMKEPVGGREKK